MKNFAANWNTQDKISGVAFNDIYLDENRQLAVVSGVDEIQQTTAQNLQLWKGENNFNTSDGIPYKLILANPNIDDALVILYLETQIMKLNEYMSEEEFAEYGINRIAALTFDTDRTTRNTLVDLLVRLNNSEQVNISTI